MTTEITEERVQLALNAAWEIESIAESLIEAAQKLDASDLLVRGLSVRARSLSTAIMSALDDDAVSIDDIRETVTGVCARHTDEGAARRT